jgi:uncharacterized protein (DUF1697 family)
MTVRIALLRAVNVAGHGGVSMAALRKLFIDLGFGDAQTLLQSGNVVFTGPSGDSARLEQRLEGEAEKRLALRTAFFLRTAAEWEKELVAENPFPGEAKSDPSHLVAMCLKTEPDVAAVKALQTGIKGPELVRAGRRHIYITYPAGIGRSRLTAPVIEKALGTAGTARNWNTVLKLARLANG